MFPQGNTTRNHFTQDPRHPSTTKPLFSPGETLQQPQGSLLWLPPLPRPFCLFAWALEESTTLLLLFGHEREATGRKAPPILRIVDEPPAPRRASLCAYTSAAQEDLPPLSLLSACLLARPAPANSARERARDLTLAAAGQAAAGLLWRPGFLVLVCVDSSVCQRRHSAQPLLFLVLAQCHFALLKAIVFVEVHARSFPRRTCS